MLPLAGVKVIEFCQVLAGPFCGCLLADMGADVIKVEAPDGDLMRQWPPLVDGYSQYFASVNRNKRSVFLPELPTLAESGVAGYEFDTWYGLHTQAKVSKDIVTKLNAMLNKALAGPAKDMLFKAGLEANGGTPEAFRKYMVSEIQKMGKIIKASGAKPEV